MSRIDDDNVEDFFRNADASRFETSYNENDWEKMALRLDQEEERLALLKRKKAGRYALLAIALLLLLTTTVYLINRGNTTQEAGSPNELKQTDLPVSDDNQTLQHDTGTPDNGIENPQANVDNRIKGNISVSTEEAESGFRNHSEKSPSVEKSRADKLFSPQATNNPSTGVKTEGESAISEIDNGKNQNLVSEGIIVESLYDEDNRQLQNDTDDAHLNEGVMPQTEVAADSLMVKEEKSDSLVQMEDAMLVDKEDNREQDSTPLASRWMISFSIAPDFSKTPKSTFDVPVGSMGVIVSYQFARRWNISTGIARVNKQYWGYGDEYHPPYGYWNYVTNGVVPEKVEGNCLVLEIPLSLTYNVVETKRSRLFVSAGVSSYLMRSEEYVYTFEEPNPGAASGWSTDKPSSYWFDIGSLSVGYDFRVSPAVSLGVEPYYKVPFGGMGWADIDMYSTGILFSARYRFLKRE